MGFHEDYHTYRSRARATKRREQQAADRLKKVEERNELLFAMYTKMQEKFSSRPEADQIYIDPAADGPSNRRSSVASTGLHDDDGEVDASPMDRYPVDNIEDKTECELHQPMKNISVKVAVGFALKVDPEVRWHCREVLAGYARLGVDEIVPGCETLEIDHPGPEGEATPEEVRHEIILWKKKYIIFPGSTQRPRSLSPPPPPSPLNFDRDDDDTYMTPPRSSPPRQQPEPSSPEPSSAEYRAGKRKISQVKWGNLTKCPPPPTKAKLSPLPKVPKSPPKFPYPYKPPVENMPDVSIDPKK